MLALDSLHLQELERQAAALAASQAAAASAEEQHAAAEDQLRSQLMRSEAECERLQVRRIGMLLLLLLIICS